MLEIRFDVGCESAKEVVDKVCKLATENNAIAVYDLQGLGYASFNDHDVFAFMFNNGFELKGVRKKDNGGHIFYFGKRDEKKSGTSH